MATVLCVSREGGDKLTTYEKKAGRRYRNNDHYCVRIMGLECLFKKLNFPNLLKCRRRFAMHF